MTVADLDKNAAFRMPSSASSGTADFYSVLGLRPYRVSSAEIAEAAQHARQRLQTVSSESNPACASSLAAIDRAERCLSDPERKRDYDRQLRKRTVTRPLTRSAVQQPAKDSNSPPSGCTRHVRRAGGDDSTRISSEPCRATTAAAAVPASNSLSTDYEILGEIGRGEDSIVYEAYDCALKRYVAIKQLAAQSHDDPRCAEAFWQAATFQAGLQHENIVRILGVDHERRWIIMELMRGNLQQQISSGPASPDLVQSILLQSLRALQFLHERHVVHGEIKPENVLIDPEGRVKLSDSRGCSLAGEFSQPPRGLAHAAPELMNPEEFGPVGPGVDLYPLGFLALELLLGGRLEQHVQRLSANHPAEKSLAWLRWHGSPTEGLLPLRQMVPNVPAELAAVIERLTRKRVAERYGSAAEAIDDLVKARLPGVDRAPSSPAEAAVLRFGHGDAEFPTIPFRDDSHDPNSVRNKWRRIASPSATLLAAGALLLAILVLAVAVGPSNCTDLQVTSTPQGAMVELVGDLRRFTTPAVLQLPRGTHHLVVSADGYRPMSKSITLDGRCARSSLDFPLQPSASEESTVYIETVPPGATVSVDGRVQPGNTPVSLRMARGTHTLELTLEGHETHTGQISVVSDSEIFDYRLLQNRFPVRIMSTPSGAHIYINGVRHNETTPATVLLPRGKYTIELQLDGHQTTADTIPVDRETDLQKPLTRVVEKIQARFSSTPNSAALTIDGTPAGMTPTTLQLEPGQHVVVLGAPGHHAKTDTITLDANHTTFDFQLEAAGPAVEASEVDQLRRETTTVAILSPVGLDSDPARATTFRNRLIEMIEAAQLPNESALASIERLTDRDPRLYYAAGLLYEKHHQLDAALKQYRRAMKIGDVPYFAAWRRAVLVGLRYNDGRRKEVAMADLINLVHASANMVYATPSPEARRELARNALFSGRVLGYLDALRRTRRTRQNFVDHDTCIRYRLEEQGGLAWVALFDQEKKDVVTTFNRLRSEEDAADSANRQYAETHEKWVTRGEIVHRSERGPHEPKELDPDYVNNCAFDGMSCNRDEPQRSEVLRTSDRESVTEFERIRRVNCRKVVRLSEELESYCPRSLELECCRLKLSLGHTGAADRVLSGTQQRRDAKEAMHRVPAANANHGADNQSETHIMSDWKASAPHV